MIALVGAALAAPGHVRAVAVQPGSLEELDGEREVRVWWDLAPATVEVDTGGGWEVVAVDALPGVSVGELPPEARIRVGGAEVVPVWGLDASQVARLVAPGTLPGTEVADVWPTEDGAWVALLGGGLVRVHKNHLVATPYGLPEGLPSNQVNAVREHEGVLWVGTGLGLARLDGSLVLDDTLPDPWVQALGSEGESLWVGTYRGLARVRRGAVETVLAPASVFSVEPGSDERAWVGYVGLRGLPTGEPIEGVDEHLNVWDVHHDDDGSLIASDEEGVLRLREGVLLPVFPTVGTAYALAEAGGVWAAADLDGLVEVGTERVQRWLPGEAVYEVVEGPPGKLWVGTDDGLALVWPEHDTVAPWPVSPAAEGRPAHDVLQVGEVVLLGGERLALVGEPRRRHRALGALPGPVLGLEALGQAIWVLTPSDAWRVDRRLHRVDLPEAPSHSAVAAGSLWIAGEALWRYDGGADRFLPGPDLGRVTDLDGRGATLWAAAGGRVVAVGQDGSTRDFVEVRLPTCLAADASGVWVGSVSGLQRLEPGGEVSEVPGFDDGVVDLAVGPDAAYALVEPGLVLRVPTGVPVGGAPDLWGLGELHGLRVDDAGRIWVLGARGYAVVPDG